MNDDNKITLHAFAELVAKRAKVGEVEADTYIHQFAKTISEELEAGGDIHLSHFGRFHTTHVDEQAGHNPNSGAPLTIPGHSRVHFHAYGALRFAVNAPFNQLRIRELTPDKTAWRTRTGVWILLALLALLLIALGMRSKSGVSAPDAPLILSATAAPIEAQTTPAVAAATGVVVSPGDTLWGIAATRLGDSGWWPIIYAENRPELSLQNPDLIDSGITLRIPALAGGVNNPSVADLRLKTNGYQIAADDYQKLGNPRAAEYEKVAARWSKE